MAAFWCKEFAMKWTRSAALTVAFALVSFGTGLFASPTETRAADDASVAIKSTIDGFNDSFNHHDAHAVAMWFTEDADFINTQQAESHGRSGIEEHFVPLFAGRLKNAHRTCTVKSVRLITPDVAAVTMDYVLTGTTGTNGEVVPVRKGLYDWIVTKQNGKWLINVLHESELAQPPAVVPVR
jgi:uncharacterized protein (TIGR02246 family)